MDQQDNKFNYRISLVALIAILISLLIAFYYSYASSTNQISLLEQQKLLLTRDNTLMKTDVDRLSALNEVNDIELQDSKFKVQTLTDSIGRLNFSLEKYRDASSEIRRLEIKIDSLRLKNNFLRYSNTLLSNKYEEVKKALDGWRGKDAPSVETKSKDLNKKPDPAIKTKKYLALMNAEGSGFRNRSGKYIKTNKANIISQLRGCVTVMGDPKIQSEVRILYLQFLGPNMEIIRDHKNTISVNGNVYSKRREFKFLGAPYSICESINLPEGSLEEGLYTLNIFEDEKLLATTEFHLK